MAATAAAAASLFEALDKDGDGKVSASELRGCAAAALDEEEAAAVVAAADADGDGLLCRDEFLGLAREAAAAADQQADDDADGSRRRCLRVAFGMFADDGATAEGQEQCITPASLQRMLARLVVGANKQQQQLALDLDECRAMICRLSPLIPSSLASTPTGARASAQTQDTTEHGATPPSPLPSSDTRPRAHSPNPAGPRRRLAACYHPASADPARRAAPRRVVPGGASEGCLLGSVTRVARTTLGDSDLVPNSIFYLRIWPWPQFSELRRTALIWCPSDVV